MIDTTTLQTGSEIKDLGITISSDLKWRKHIWNIKNSANTRCYQILKTFNTPIVWTLVKAYNTYVRPLLEYNTTIWSPYLKKDIQYIEAVQRSFTKKICFRCSVPFTDYADRLSKLNMESLEYRRLKNDIIMTYKIYFGLINVQFNNFFEHNLSPYGLRKHKYSLKYKDRPNLLQRKHYFSNRVITVWNLLPEFVLTPNNLPLFKTKLNRIDLHEYTELLF